MIGSRKFLRPLVTIKHTQRHQLIINCSVFSVTYLVWLSPDAAEQKPGAGSCYLNSTNAQFPLPLKQLENFAHANAFSRKIRIGAVVAS